MAVTLNDLIYRSGDIFLPKEVRSFLSQYLIGGDTTNFYINNWSIVHFFTGLIAGSLFRYFNVKNVLWKLLFIHIAWELWQIIIGMTPYTTLRGQVDTITDTALFMLGGLVSVKLPRKFTL